MSFLIYCDFLAIVGVVEEAGDSFSLGVQEFQVKRLSWLAEFERGIGSRTTQ